MVALYKIRDQFKRHIKIIPDDLVKIRFMEMFQEIQEPYNNYCWTRKKFLNYNFIARKFAERLNRYDLLYLFPNLRTKRSLQEYNTIWENISNDLTN